jgi:hypothetical protein
VQNRAHKYFVFERKSGIDWPAMNETRPPWPQAPQILFLDGAEGLRNIRRQIEDSAFMKKARLHRMQASPIHCPPSSFLTFLS